MSAKNSIEQSYFSSDKEDKYMYLWLQPVAKVLETLYRILA